MADAKLQRLTTPRRADLGLTSIGNESGMLISVLPNGAIFAIEHVYADHRIMINRSLGSPIAGSMTYLYLRIGGREPMMVPLAGAAACGQVGATADCFTWKGETRGVHHQAMLRLHADQNLWLWHIEVRSARHQTLPCDTVLIQDLGLGEPGFLMNNEAYASQYLDHYVACDSRIGPVLMARQNLAQDGRHPWVAHGCLERAAGFATDFRQLLGPAHRDADGFAVPFGTDLPSVRLQHESACAALQSAAVTLSPGAAASWTFFGAYRADHTSASTDADLALVDGLAQVASARSSRVPLRLPVRSLLQGASALVADALDELTLRERYPRQLQREQLAGRLLSFFTRDATGSDTSDSRHVVLRDKERLVLRSHGALLRGGAQLLPDDATLCVTCWMPGIFGAQLTIGNTAFHRLFSLTRDPYNIGRGSGLRMLVDTGEGWRLLTVPSAFEMGLVDCRWVYRLGGRTITVGVIVASDAPAAQWSIAVEGPPCRFLVFCQLVLGEQEFAHAGQLEIDTLQRRFAFRPDPGTLWGQRYPQAVYHLVTSTPESIESLGGDELLYADGKRRSGAYATMQTLPTGSLVFAVVGTLTDPQDAAELAARYARGCDDAALRAGSMRFWRGVTRGIRFASTDADDGVSAVDSIFPWMVHDAMVHLTVPHGLEQYSGGAWGTRDVCQGPMESLLALEHDEPAKAILRALFAQQYAQRGDWPQWFMLEPYSAIQEREAHGDVIVWPLKALCDYVEATGDFAVLEELVPWRRDDNLERSANADPIAIHVDRLIATVRERFVPGTRLIRYGYGDWNDSLQPVDPAKRDWMVSSWTVALLYEQLCRYAEVLRRAGHSDAAAELRLAAAVREDFNRFLVRDGTVAGYGVFGPAGSLPELLFHPHDQRTGVAYSLLPMTQAILGGLFTPEQTRHHLALIRTYLSNPDGVRLLNRPLAYHGGLQAIFQRAESAAYFGREIGLMYTHAHLRYAQALSVLGEAQELWEALLAVNPIAVTDRLAHASLRQRNTYFSSSDADFRDRYQACREWPRVRAGTIAVEGGWRIYSSGPGVCVNLLIRHALGARRDFGVRVVRPCLPGSLGKLRLEWPARPAPGSPLQ